MKTHEQSCYGLTLEQTGARKEVRRAIQRDRVVLTGVLRVKVWNFIRQGLNSKLRLEAGWQMTRAWQVHVSSTKSRFRTCYCFSCMVMYDTCTTIMYVRNSRVSLKYCCCGTKYVVEALVWTLGSSSLSCWWHVILIIVGSLKATE